MTCCISKFTSTLL